MWNSVGPVAASRLSSGMLISLCQRVLAAPLEEKRAEPEPLTLTGLCSILPTCDCRGRRVSFGTHALCSLPSNTRDRILQRELSACHAGGLSTNDAVFLTLLWAQCHENTRTTPSTPRTRYFLPESHTRGCLRIQASPLWNQ